MSIWGWMEGRMNGWKHAWGWIDIDGSRDGDGWIGEAGMLAKFAPNGTL